MNENCYFNDHDWRGGGICVHCGERLRCLCGAFVREDGIKEHLATCRVAAGLLAALDEIAA